MDKVITVGLEATKNEIVSLDNCAKTVKSGSLEVYATPAMIALAEYTACAALQDYLPEGMTSVGTHLDIKHLSATPIGMKVTCVASVAAVEGRKISFSIVVQDEAGLIGEGNHERFLVKLDSFMEKTMEKLK